jgi:hypothetical protein
LGRIFKEGKIIKQDIEKAGIFYDFSYSLGYVDALNAKVIKFNETKGRNDTRRFKRF